MQSPQAGSPRPRLRDSDGDAPASTVCGYVAEHRARRAEDARVLTLGELVHEPLDMFTTVLIGNAETQERFGRMLTPRGYRL